MGTIKFLVLSDSHGQRTALRRALAAQPEARQVFFLGDGWRDIEAVREAEPERTFLAVPGNCDAGVTQPPVGETVIGGIKIFFTHGHLYRVKWGTELLVQAARSRGATLALFGHTHMPCERYDSGVQLFNPGSIGYKETYGLIEVGSGGLLTQVMTLR